MAMKYGNELIIARDVEGNEIRLSPEERAEHFYATGITGTGKSKFLEGLIRQDIENWPGREYGILLLDWHGSIYDGLMKWLESESYYVRLPILPIDLRRDEWVVAYNFLRKRNDYYDSVLTDLLVKQLVYIWGAGDTNQTPNIDNSANLVFLSAISEGLSLREASRLLEDENFRRRLGRSAKSPAVREAIERLNSLNATQLYAMVNSTRTRLRRLGANQHMEAMLNQPGVSLDFSQALEENWIILVSLAQGARASGVDAQTFATVMLSDLWAAMQQRGKPDNSEDVRPFYTYIDEFQNFVTPSITENLDQARGFGLHLTMAHQYPTQVRDANPVLGPRLYSSVMMNTRNKIVFQIPAGTEGNLEPLNDWLFMNTWDTREIKFEQKTRGVVDYEEQTRDIFGHTDLENSTSGRGRGRGHHAAAGIVIHTPGLVDGVAPLVGPSQSVTDTSGDTDSENFFEGEGRGSADTKSTVPVFLPLFGEQVSSTQFYTLEEQKHATRKQIIELKNREGIVKLSHMDVPVKITTAPIEPIDPNDERILAFRAECLAQFPFVLSFAEARAKLAHIPAIDLGVNGSSASEDEALPVARRAKKRTVEKQTITHDDGTAKP